MAESNGNGRSQTPGGGGTGGALETLTTNDALSFLKQVRDVFCDQSEKYVMFLDTLIDFKAGRVDTNGVIASVKALFKGHNDLILGFKLYLPEGYEIIPDEEDAISPKQTVEEAEKALSFVIKTGENNEECSICLRIMGAGFIELECSHRFHAQCFKTWWSKYNPTCRYCRLRVKENGEKDPLEEEATC